MSIKFPAGVPMWPLAKLTTYFRNPRTHTQEQVETLARLIKRYGWTDPIIVDETQGILAGHLRYATALHMNLPEVPVIEVTHLSDAEKKAFVIAHNQIALRSKWDKERLVDELEAIRDADLDMGLTAFTDAELEAIEGSIAQALTTLDGPMYNPDVAPTTSKAEVTEADVEAVEEGMGKRFQHNPFLRQVVCPHCGEEYYLDAAALKLGKGDEADGANGPV